MEKFETLVNIIDNWFSSIIKKELWYALNILDIGKALKEIWCIWSNHKVLQYSDVDWFIRSGWETYWSIFKILTTDGVTTLEKKYFVKAIVRSSVVDSLKDFSNRRNHLEFLKIPVSKRYHAHRWLIIEDYYPFDYRQVTDIDLLIEICIAVQLAN